MTKEFSRTPFRCIGRSAHSQGDSWVVLKVGVQLLY